MQGWQTTFIAGVVGWTMVREWPWTHTVFFVLHGLVMVMKQHSYAFYNGYLSTVYIKRKFVLAKLKQLERLDPTNGPSPTEPAAASISTSHLKEKPSVEERRHSMLKSSEAQKTDIDRIARAVASRQPLDDEQLHVFGRIMRWEVDALTDELKGTAAESSKAYPANLGFIEHYKWIPLPTVVYELEYPRTETVSWAYVVEKLVAMVGVIFVMIQVSQHSICKHNPSLTAPSSTYCGPNMVVDPVVMKTIAMKERGDTLSQRFEEFPWLLSDLIFPFMMEYLVRIPTSSDVRGLFS